MEAFTNARRADGSFLTSFAAAKGAQLSGVGTSGVAAGMGDLETKQLGVALEGVDKLKDKIGHVHPSRRLYQFK